MLSVADYYTVYVFSLDKAICPDRAQQAHSVSLMISTAFFKAKFP